MFDGQVITGGVTSRMVTVKVHVLRLAAASVAVQVTVVTPMGKVEPEGGVQVTFVTAQLSVAAAA
jgi:hypothetical protein